MKGIEPFSIHARCFDEIVQASGGLTYQQLYQAINLANRQSYWINEGGDLYDEPRQVRFGIRLGI